MLCDCLFVVKGVQQILLGSQPTRLDHQDLSKRICTIIQFRGAEFFGIRKVKAHVTQQQVDEGVITEFERMMNEGVDGVAKSAANAHAIDPELAAKAYRRSWVTKYIQVMMVRILEAWIEEDAFWRAECLTCAPTDPSDLPFPTRALFSCNLCKEEKPRGAFRGAKQKCKDIKSWRCKDCQQLSLIHI